ncbi:hypothetical protein Vretimale_5759 [Volvox reticuliferus]|uniref:Nuclear pore protein n=1 Tax=Volvox reticuliferus TaxID=1737510 RepID=A0A8J4G6D8_9CHLO|nr:hypothetical protein Vretifemale_5684 [Volvox reticuliferus]GIM00882.1 hypothetical protein Vretimale_5759 [Volvox reticuliferus]
MADWNTLLQQSADLVGQDFNNVPRVERNLPQLQQYADALRSRTNRYRGPSEQAAATRLLAQQGLDAGRLTSEVMALEIVPTIEDVFHAETNNVEEYLQQVEEATLLAAIQEAQQESMAAFDAFMDQCITRDWNANKQRLFSLIAPSGLPGGPQPLIGRSAAGNGGQGFATAGPRLSPKEAAYVEIAKDMAVAAGSRSGAQAGMDFVKRFKEACEKYDEKPLAQDLPISTIWGLVVRVLNEARRRNVTPASPGRYVDALVAGARKHLEEEFQHHVRTTITRHKMQAERGADPDPLREVQAFIQVKFRDRGPLDFAAPNGMDTSWVQLFYCLRAGYDRAAARVSERCGDLLLLPTGSRASGMGMGANLRQMVDEWLRNNCRLSERHAASLSREVERLLRDKNGLRSSLRAPYQALVCALLVGDVRAVDALSAGLQSAGLPAILSTIDDYMWARLALVGGGSGVAAGVGGSATLPQPGLPVPIYTIAELQTDINRFPPQYYSKQNREPLAYVMVLLVSLQWATAVRFLWRDDTTKPYRLDAVHMGLALFAEGALAALSGAGTGAAGAAGPEAMDMASLALQYSRKFVTAGDAATALYYRWLAAIARGGTLAIKGAMLRELLVGERDFGTLLGGGGAGARGALHALVADTEERRQLFESVAQECQMSAQPEEAVELFLAADRPVQALIIINNEMSAAIMAAVNEAPMELGALSGNTTSSMGRMERIARSGRAAVERVTGERYREPLPSSSAVIAGDPAARREVEAFHQLGVIREILMAAKGGRYDQVLQRLPELPFIPTERSRLAECVRITTQLHPAIAERLQDVVAAVADAIAARGKVVGREAANQLANELNVLTSYANSMSGTRLPQAVYRKISEAQVFVTPRNPFTPS